MKKPHRYKLSQCYSYSIIIREFSDIENGAIGEALKRIQSDLAECMPQLEFDIQVIEG